MEHNLILINSINIVGTENDTFIGTLTRAMLNKQFRAQVASALTQPIRSQISYHGLSKIYNKVGL